MKSLHLSTYVRNRKEKPNMTDMKKQEQLCNLIGNRTIYFRRAGWYNKRSESSRYNKGRGRPADGGGIKMQNISNEDIKLIEFRRNKLRELTSQIERTISGKNHRFAPYISRENGKYSEEKTWQFIDRLMNCLERYLQYKYDGKRDVLTDEERDFYRSFLYCAIRGDEMMDLSSFDMIHCRTIGDILSLAADPDTIRIGWDVELLFEERFHESALGGFFGRMNEIYAQLKGEHIISTVTEEEWERVRRAYPQFSEMEEQQKNASITIEDQLKEEGMTDEEIEAWLDERDWYGLEELDWLQEDEFARYMEEQEEIAAALAGNFENKDVFCEQYLLYRKLYFQVDYRKLPEYIEWMLNLFLHEEDLSCYEEDRFLTAYIMLKKTAGRIRQSMRNRVE